jgi:methylmalonyl-CoA mutase cobalamin-binding domain/chain
LLLSAELVRIEKMLGDLEEDRLLAAVKDSLSAGDDPMAIVEACRNGMEEVGKRFSAEEYFVSELIVSAELFNSVMKLLGPALAASTDGGPKTKVVIGTVKGDVHDIGKDIVVAMLRCNGFDVYDVGVDAPPQVFVDKVRETGAQVVGLSGLLTVAFATMETTVKALKDAGLKTKVMIGGGMTNDMVRAKVGADAWGHDAMEAVRLARSFGEVKAK